MPRSSWKGYLKLSLVSCAVALYNASSASERVSFNTLNRRTGNRLKQNLVDSVTGDPVDTADRVKGYQVSKGQYVMVEDEDLEALKIESTRTIEIETFVPQAGPFRPPGNPDEWRRQSEAWRASLIEKSFRG